MKIKKSNVLEYEKISSVPLPKISFIQIYGTKQQIFQGINILIALPIQYLFPNKLLKKKIFCYFVPSHTSNNLI